MDELKGEIIIPEAVKSRGQWLLSIAVCRTKRGLRTHLNLVGIEDLRVLLRFLSCSLDELEERAWAYREGA